MNIYELHQINETLLTVEEIMTGVEYYKEKFLKFFDLDRERVPY